MKKNKFFDVQTSLIFLAVIVIALGVVYLISAYPVEMPPGESKLIVRVNAEEPLADETQAVTTVSQNGTEIARVDVACNEDVEIITLGEGTYQVATEIHSEGDPNALGINENDLKIDKNSGKETHFEYNYFQSAA